ncbi:MAG: ester cyclase [Actinobacteria bacterium]|nr:ester cyclase [Actinomycetota bacterium]
MTTDDEAVALLRRAVDLVNQGREDEQARECLALDFVRHDLAGVAETRHGRGSATEAAKQIRAALGDMQIEIVDAFACNSRVTARMILRGRHTGELFGIAPTGGAFAINGLGIYAVADERITEAWVLFDLLGALRQAGSLTARGGTT